MSDVRLGISLDGVEGVNDMLAELGEDVGTWAIRVGAMRGGALIAERWRAEAPRRSGRMAESIHHEEVSDDSQRQADISTGVGFAGVIIGPDRRYWYGHFTEGGTEPHELGSHGGFHPGIAAQRTGQRVLDENADEVVGFIRDEIKAAVDQAGTR